MKTNFKPAFGNTCHVWPNLGRWPVRWVDPLDVECVSVCDGQDELKLVVTFHRGTAWPFIMSLRARR